MQHPDGSGIKELSAFRLSQPIYPLNPNIDITPRRSGSESIHFLGYFHVVCAISAETNRYVADSKVRAMHPSRLRMDHVQGFKVHPHSTLAEWQSSLDQDPGILQFDARQDPTGPDDDMFLHDPSTASSGRKLITETLGDSYGSFF
ncbi:MAG TPA: hypothetical protein VNX87_26295 [Candidatus Sulfotelmatobacter sp.]|nr:hypothetical protein [Candidatus Sulfotelmatobacter sp.]